MDKKDDKNEKDEKENEQEEEFPRPITDYYKDTVDIESDEIPLPFGQYVVPASGENTGDRLGTPPSRALITLEGEWDVVQESNKGRYPVALISRLEDGVIAATLTTFGGGHQYRNAFLAYAPDVGTFSMAEVAYSSDVSSIPTIGQTQDSLAERFVHPKTPQPFLWTVESEGNRNDTQYVCCRVEGHQPWKVLKRNRLSGWRKLRERYKTATTEIGLEFNPVPPEKRKNQNQTQGNPERGKQLNEMYREKILDNSKDEPANN